MPLHPILRKRLKVDPDLSDDDVLRIFKKRSRQYCKPCWELKYCPYGPLVEQFPLLPLSLEQAERLQADHIHCLKTGHTSEGDPLTQKDREALQKMVDSFNPKEYPTIPLPIQEACCRVFGHICPVYFVAESFTETKDLRSRSRSIPRDVMLKVVRRDGQICQRCYQPVPDDQVEFDHIIPFSKGGSSTTENLRLCCRSCNRQKTNSIDEIVGPNHFG